MDKHGPEPPNGSEGSLGPLKSPVSDITGGPALLLGSSIRPVQAADTSRGRLHLPLGIPLISSRTNPQDGSTRLQTISWTSADRQLAQELRTRSHLQRRRLHLNHTKLCISIAT